MFAFPVVWRDTNRHGLNGVVEIQSSDFAKGIDNAKVRDLMVILNKKIADLPSRDYGVREVNCIMLHGVQARSDSRLEYLVPELMGSRPRFVATTQHRSMPTRGIRMTVFVTTLAGSSIAINCLSTDTIDFIKMKIEVKIGMLIENQRLVFAGKQLQDQQTLSFYNIENASTLLLTGRIRGGDSGSFAQSRTFADVSDGSILTATEFSDRAPEWRICSKGLNIEGRCENSDCPAFGHMAIHRKKFEYFNLMRDDDVRCPLCRWRMKPITCGLYDCLWHFEGMKADDGMSVYSPWKDAQGYLYHRFNADENNHFVDWANLVMVVKPREGPVINMLLHSMDSVDLKTDDLCAVCWSTFDRDAIKKTHCGHSFHRVCIDTWSDRSKKNHVLPSCPICRRSA